MRRQVAAAYLSGLVMAAGLCLSGMTDPARVLGFLDFLGRWDPTLAFVMMGAMSVHALLCRVIIRRRTPLFAAEFSIPKKRELDGSLLIGSALFGAGWGLAGYCPGPLVASLPTGGGSALVFAVGMFAGMATHGVAYRERRRPAPALGGQP